MRYLGALLLGVVVALCAVAVHRSTFLGLPAGLVLAVLATVLTAVHLRRGEAPRTAAAFCLGWLAVLGLVLTGRPEGDFVLADDVRGYALMGVGLLLVVIGIGALVARAPERVRGGRPT